jgi:membrane protein
MAHASTILEPGQRGVHAWLGIFKNAATAFVDDYALRLSAALAYYSIFSLAPLLVITLGIAGLFLHDKAATGQLYDQLAGYVGPKSAAVLQAMVESASKPKTGVIATVLGSIALLFGASGVLGQLKDALNTIWEVRQKKGAGIGYFIRTKFLNFGMVLVVGLLLLVSLVLSTFLATLNQNFSEALHLPAWVWTILGFVVSLGLETVLFALIFKVLPDAKIRWRDVWWGALITALLFELGKWALSWYLGRQGAEDAYGPASAVVLLILWVYYASCIMLYGAEFTQAWAAASGHVIEPSANAVSMAAANAAADRATPSEVAPEKAVDAVREDSEVPDPAARPARYRAKSPFSGRLLNPILKYLEGRGMLVSIEAKEALGQGAMILVLALVCVVVVFVAWILLAVTLVGLITSYFEWSWIAAAATTAGVHLLAGAVVALLAWRKVTKGSWFEETLNELRKDRLWLRGTPN